CPANSCRSFRDLREEKIHRTLLSGRKTPRHLTLPENGPRRGIGQEGVAQRAWQITIGARRGSSRPCVVIADRLVQIGWDFEAGIADANELPIPRFSREAMPLKLEWRG